jgi:phosphohistidine phosphatase
MKSVIEQILWRHAEAAPGTPDVARSLVETGRRHAQLMARWLRPRLPSDLVTLSSPPVRTRPTAKALLLPFNVSDALAKDSSAKAILDAANWPANPRSMMLVGHQPGLGELLNLLLGAMTPLDDMPKAGIWWLATRLETGRLVIDVKALFGPETLDGYGP